MKKVLMSLLLAVCLVTGVMPQMAVKAEMVSQEDMVDIGDTTVGSVPALEKALQSVANVTQDSTGYITVSLQKNIVGRPIKYPIRITKTMVMIASMRLICFVFFSL